MRHSHRCHTGLSLHLFRDAAYITAMRLGGAQKRSATEIEKRHIMNITRSLNNWRKYRQTVTELGRMTDRELRDLGIGREDIRRVARQAVAG